MKRYCSLRNALLVVLTLVGGSGLAFNLDGRRWLDGSTVIHVGMPGTSPSGKRWATAAQEAMAEWTTLTPFHFIVNNDYLDPCKGYSRNNSGGGFPSGGGDGKNGIDFRTTVCGNDFGEGTLAITLTLSQRGTLGFDYIIESDIVVNDKYNWDIYSGTKFGSQDFYRVMLHELGHALGLDHESTAVAIMAPTVSSLRSLQADDVAGADAIYGVRKQCVTTDLALHARVNNSLAQGDCRILDLYGGGDDTSYVDTYRLTLSKTTRLHMTMSSAQVDSVLVLTDAKFKSIEIFDDSQGACDAKGDITLGPGEYFLLANTYVNPNKCAGNVGGYTLTLTDSNQPELGAVLNTAGGASAASLISGGTSSDGGLNYRTSFAATEVIDVSARVGIDPTHVGMDGRLYVLVVLGSGQQFSKNAAGQFVPFNGQLSQLQAVKSGPLAAVEVLDIVRGLQGRSAGLAGQQVSVFVGYALTSNPNAIHYGSQPISFSIGL
jgi:hypothetical protein